MLILGMLLSGKAFADDIVWGSHPPCNVDGADLQVNWNLENGYYQVIIINTNSDIVYNQTLPFNSGNTSIGFSPVLPNGAYTIMIFYNGQLLSRNTFIIFL